MELNDWLFFGVDPDAVRRVAETNDTEAVEVTFEEVSLFPTPGLDGINRVDIQNLPSFLDALGYHLPALAGTDVAVHWLAEVCGFMNRLEGEVLCLMGLSW